MSSCRRKTASVGPDDRFMAAFTHLNPNGSRFSDGTYGVFHAANELGTAIAETEHHREQFLSATAQAHMELDMRVYLVDLDGDLHDLRGQKAPSRLSSKTTTTLRASIWRETLREAGSNGIACDSVRRTGGEWVAVSGPLLLSNARQERHLCYVWSGQKLNPSMRNAKSATTAGSDLAARQLLTGIKSASAWTSRSKRDRNAVTAQEGMHGRV